MMVIIIIMPLLLLLLIQLLLLLLMMMIFFKISIGYLCGALSRESCYKTFHTMSVPNQPTTYTFHQGNGHVFTA